MIPNLIDRFLGRVGRVLPYADASISSLTTTPYTAGDVLNPTAVCLPLTCIAHGKGDTVTLRKVDVWEYCDSGTRQHAPLRIYFFDADYVVPAQNTAFYTDPATATMIGFVDVAAGEYIDYDNITPGAPHYAAAFVELVDTDTIGARPMTMKLGSTTRNLYAVVTTTGTPTFAASATLSFRFHFEG